MKDLSKLTEYEALIEMGKFKEKPAFFDEPDFIKPKAIKPETSTSMELITGKPLKTDAITDKIEAGDTVECMKDSPFMPGTLEVGTWYIIDSVTSFGNFYLKGIHDTNWSSEYFCKVQIEDLDDTHHGGPDTGFDCLECGGLVAFVDKNRHCMACAADIKAKFKVDQLVVYKEGYHPFQSVVGKVEEARPELVVDSPHFDVPQRLTGLDVRPLKDGETYLVDTGELVDLGIALPKEARWIVQNTLGEPVYTASKRKPVYDTKIAAWYDAGLGWNGGILIGANNYADNTPESLVAVHRKDS